MPLWGNKDREEDKPKYLSDADKANTIFVDASEIGSENTKAKGITSAGWVLTKTKTDSEGNIKYMSETLVAIGRSASDAGDTDDGVSAATLKITTQPESVVITEAGDPTSFTVVADDVVVTYQWQVREGSGSYRNIVVEDTEYEDFTTDTLVVLDSTGLGGYKYRCVVSSSVKGISVTSSPATLTESLN